jgi:hypothetical protein
MAKFSMFGSDPTGSAVDAVRNTPQPGVAPLPSNVNKPVQPYVGDKEVQRRAMDWAGGGSVTPQIGAPTLQPQQPSVLNSVISANPPPIQMQPNNPTTVPTAPGVVNPANEFERIAAAQKQAAVMAPPIPIQPTVQAAVQPAPQSSLVNNLMGYNSIPQGVQRNPYPSILSAPQGW